MTERVLDRVPSRPDPIRQSRYNLAAAVVNLEPRPYTWAVPFHLDQRNEGACVGHAWTHEAVGRPVMVNFTRHALPVWAARSRDALGRGGLVKDVAQAFAFDHYEHDRRIDEWPGENYEGTSVAAGAKASAEANLLGVGEYRWGNDVHDVAVAVSRKGPAVLGIDWWSGMFAPDANGFLRVAGRIEGGHAILCKGFSFNPVINGKRWTGRPAFRLHNSWGSDWGVGGDAWIDYDALGQLLEARGECCIPMERIL